MRGTLLKSRAIFTKRINGPPFRKQIDYPDKLYTLRSIPSNNWMGFVSKHPYIVAFCDEQQAKFVCSFAHEGTKMHLEMENEDACLNIDKKSNINKLGCEVTPIPSIEFYNIPFEHCMGIVMAKTIIQDTTSMVRFRSEVIDPLQDIDLFRMMLIQTSHD